MIEGLLVAEEHGFVAHRQLVPVAADGDQPDRRRGGSLQLGLGLLADIGAGGQLRLLGGQLHGKGHAGGIVALFAVRLGSSL